MHKTTFDTPIGKVAYDAQGDLKAFKFVVHVAQGRDEDRRQVKTEYPPAHAALSETRTGRVRIGRICPLRGHGAARRHRALRAATP